MSSSTCPKCGSHSFEVKENSPKNSRYKLLFVQCSSCGTPVGVMDFWNIGTIVKNMEGKIEKLQTLEGQLAIVNQNIAIIFEELKKRR